LTVRAYIGVGSNLGDRWGHCMAAVRALDDLPGTRVVAVSSWYETEPVEGAIVSGRVQDWFVNGVVAIDTPLPPRAVLTACLDIEHSRGRERSARHAPRTLDLDLLLYGDAVLDERDLVVPHPRMAERAFVLIPLYEIAPWARHPLLACSIATLRAELTDPHTVRPYRPIRFHHPVAVS